MTNFVTAIDNDHIVILVTANGERIRDYFYADEVTMTGDRTAFFPMTYQTYRNCVTVFGEGNF